MTGIGQTSAASLELLATALASRAGTVDELAELSSIAVGDVRDRLAALERDGYLDLAGQAITYRSPHLAISEQVERILERTRTEVDQKLDEAASLLSAIPRLLASWNDGSGDSQGARAEVFHGVFAPTDLWLRVAASTRIRATDGILPDAGRIFSAEPQMQQKWFDAISGEDFQVRTILATRDVTADGAAEVIGADMAVGAEFRMLPTPPSWLWIADDEIVGLPFRWGDSWPTSVFATRDAAVVTLMRWLYDRLWAEAVPVFDETRSWDPILALMSRGATLEAAAHALGISSRTGRRRIAAAHEYFGVDGMFALGAAWQRARDPRA